MSRGAVRVVLAAACFAACSDGVEIERRSAVEHGRDLFDTPAAAESTLNKFSCSTCHAATREDVGGRVFPGHVMAGAAQRPTYWGGQHTSLLRAINDCRYFFMNATRAWTPDDVPAKAMFAYLDSLPATDASAQPLTVVGVAADLPRGDAGRGQALYANACASCHGDAKTGKNRLRESIPVLPDESARTFVEKYGFTRDQVRVTFIEKVRHGAFLGVYGNMPLFSIEALRDEDLAAVLAHLELY